ncbi:uncharacterized protein FIBRA_04837 [Fibroporia radiculosa]|uniref:Protein LCHN n=1 Tax=Fibroporia radiculosa TaxID=599839 RepID=J4GPW7_9APHY|nr:uncharacterized protein FIBRA_04837 [Fibroporia radiculosa]CCM02730.1 predicted protein [Fibroporia radiculosa]
MSSKGKIPQDIVAIFHAAFHPTQGNVIDWSLKASDDLDLGHVEFSCLPSGLHLMERDVIYFTKGEHSGVCVFHRQKTTEEGHRGFRLSSLGILLAKSARPRPWLHLPALKEVFRSMYSSIEDRDVLVPLDGDWDPARAFFEERKVRRADLGGAGDWNGWSAELEDDAPDTDPTAHLPHLLRIIGPSSLTLYKHVLGRRRILIYTLPPVEAACILCQVAADICYQYQTEGEDDTLPDADDEPHRKLKGKSAAGVKVLGMVTLNDLSKLEEESRTGRGWVACTTDAIFLEKPSYYDLLIDLRTSTPNTRPTFYVSKPVDQSNGRGPSHRLSLVRFTWSDVKLWTELERLLQLDTGEHMDRCCDPSLGSRQSTSSWTDIWRVYEDVCVVCAGLWMGSWRTQPTLSCGAPGGRWENWGSIRLEGEESLSLRKQSRSYVRHVGMGVEGRPAYDASTSSGRTQRRSAKSSSLSVWSWTTSKGDGQGSGTAPAAGPSDPVDSEPTAKDVAMSVHIEESQGARRTQQIITTLALLQAFHVNTTAILARLAELLPQRRSQPRHDSGESNSTVILTPKDVMSFELGPFSGLDARFVEWLGEEYGGGSRVVARRNWRDLMGLLLGLSS